MNKDKSEYEEETRYEWSVITEKDLADIRRRLEEAARTAPKGESRDVQVASRAVVAMIELAREQGVSGKRLAIQMILRAGLLMGSEEFRREALAFASDVAVLEALAEAKA
jgi:hypothetical protein